MNKWPGKQRPRVRPQGRHGPVKHLVGDTPSITFREAITQHHEREFDRVNTDGKAIGTHASGEPIYASGDALSLLRELADAIERDGPIGVIIGKDDAAALRWAIGCLDRNSQY